MQICSRYARRREDAEQWAHDSFLKIFMNLAHYRNLGSFEGWMKRIVVRTCIDHIRAAQTLKNEVESHTLYNDLEFSGQQPYTSNEVLKKISAESVAAFISTLPDKQRAVFNLHVFEGYPHREIAVLMSISENHCYWLLHEARKNLKKSLLGASSQNTRA